MSSLLETSSISKRDQLNSSRNDETGNHTVMNKAITISSPCNSIDHTATSIMFVELGRGLTRGQIRSLSNVVIRKGFRVVRSLDCHPTFLVVDPFVSVETLAHYFQFQRKKGPGYAQNKRNKNEEVDLLRKLIAKYNITPVKPTWITNNRGPNFRPPKLTELYNGLIGDNHSSSKQQQMQRVPCVECISKNDSNIEPDKGEGNKASVSFRTPTIIRNYEIAQTFRRLATLYQKATVEPMDEFRAYTFHLVAGRLEQLDFEIANLPRSTAKALLRRVSGLGSSTLEMIQEWIDSRQIKRIHLLETDDQRVAIRNLIRIWGVGPKMAQLLYNKHNICTIEQLREGLRTKTIDFLNDNQKVGVECYEDFQSPMQREEVEQILALVKAELHTILPQATISAMGSYRRGKHTCGDADLLITDPNFVNCTPRLALGHLVRRLMDKGLIAYNLTQVAGMEYPDRGAADYDPYPTSQSYMGVFVSQTIPGVRRRIDIKFYPFRERVFATLYFTGCGWFNRSMRLWATRKKNLHLNDHGLFLEDGRAHHVPRPHEALLHEASSDEEVFAILGLVYKDPHERNSFDDVISIEGCTASFLNLDYKSISQTGQSSPWSNQNEYVKDLDE